jgi:hypothetical protein
VGSLRLLYFEPDKTLGPSGLDGSAVSTVLPFLNVLLGSRRFGVLGALWEKSEGAYISVYMCVYVCIYVCIYLHVCYMCVYN